jgi:histidinol-phosphate aminotransferase
MALTREYADYAEVPPETVTITNGCDKAFRLIAETLVQAGDEMLMPVPTYPVMAEAVQVMGGQVSTLSLDPKFEAPVAEMVERIRRRPQIRMIFLVNPNNPTSNVILQPDGLEEILRTDRLVVLDEAYLEIGGWSAAPLMRDYPNLILLRSFSKSFSLPGLRVATLIAHPSLTEAFQKIEHNIEIFNVATLGLHGALAALRDLDYYRKAWVDLDALRSRLANDLRAAGAEVLDSHATFLFLATPGLKSKDLNRRLAERGILIKNMALYPMVTEEQSVVGLPAPGDYDKVTEVLLKTLGRD